MDLIAAKQPGQTSFCGITNSPEYIQSNWSRLGLRRIGSASATYRIELRIKDGIVDIKETEAAMTESKSKLRRSRSNRVIAGVCGGLAEFFGISTFWFRLAFLITLLPGGVPGLLLYLLAWIIIPSA